MFDHFLYDEWEAYLKESEQPPVEMEKIRRYLLAFPEQGDPNEEYNRLEALCKAAPHPAPPFASEPIEQRPRPVSEASSSSTWHPVAKAAALLQEARDVQSDPIDLTRTTPRGSIAQALQQWAAPLTQAEGTTEGEAQMEVEECD